MCCSPWGHKELDTTEQLNSNNSVKDNGKVMEEMEKIVSVWMQD